MAKKTGRLALLATALLALALAAGCAAREKAGEPAAPPREDTPAGEERPSASARQTVRVSISLQSPSVAAAGYDFANIASDAQAQAYRQRLEREQEEITRRIEKALGRPLDVVWNITLTANAISANVYPEDMALIAAVDGVKTVEKELRSDPMTPGGSAGLNPPPSGPTA